MIKPIFTASVALLAAFAPVAAGALTYTAVRGVGTGTVDLSITTDGTIGVLNDVNIIDWTITVSDSEATFTILGPLSGNNSGVNIGGTAFSATATDLLFDYDAGGFASALFQSPLPGSSETFWCVQVSGCFDIVGPGEGILTNADFPANVERTAYAGVQVIASAVIPEPASWALMIAGFGMVGSALRRGRISLVA